ncbi:MAG: hypothetical protein AB2556_26080 [Candidatus Thiodiazotropha sp.]
MVTIPGTDRNEELVLNDIVSVSIEAAEVAIQTDDLALGYDLTVHSSQGLTIADPQEIWTIDDNLQWSNLGYFCLIKSGVSQPARDCPPDEGSKGIIHTLTMQQLRKAIAKKLVAYKRQDQAKRRHSNLKVNHVLQLKTTAVRPATSSCSGRTSQTPSSLALTAWTIPEATSAIISGWPVSSATEKGEPLRSANRPTGSQGGLCSGGPALTD